MNISQKKEQLFIFGTLIATIVLFLGFGFHHLTKFVTADEHYWIYERVPQYWNALSDGNFKKTLINDKPGITVALLSGAGLLWDKNPETLCDTTQERIITCDTNRTEKILLAFRLPLILTNTLLLIYLFWITKKLTNAWVALWASILTALSPMILGMSQIINPDSLLWSFGMAAILSFFTLLKYQERKYVFLSGFFLALALLAKYVAGILIPFFIFAFLIWTVSKTIPAFDKDSALKIIRKNLTFLFFIVLISISIIAIFLPAVWLKPSILQAVFSGGSEQPFYLLSLFSLVAISADIFLLKGKIIFFASSLSNKMRDNVPVKSILPFIIFGLFLALTLGRFFFLDWTLFERVPFDLKELTGDVNYYGPNPTPAESSLLQLNPLVFSLTPIALLLFFVFLWQQIFQKNKGTGWEFEVSMLLFFLPIYLLILTFLDVLAIPRYIIILYPIISLLSAVGAWKSKCFLENKFYFLKDTLLVGISITLIVFTFSAISLFLVRPFYSNYTNLFLSKNDLISSAWGYGGYEAAQYLNSLPNAKNLLVWSDYEGVCEFFVGRCMTKQYKYAQAQKIDYAVITRRGEILYNPDHIKWQNKKNLNMRSAYRDIKPSWSLEIDNRPKNFIRVVKVKN